MNRKIPTKHKMNFIYEEQEIPTAIYSQGSLKNVRTILYLGTLQVSYLPKIIASYCPVGTAVVQGAPHWHANENGETIPDFMWQFTEQVYDFINDNKSTAMPLNIIAESQAAPGVLRLTANSGDEIKAVVLLQPLGLNSQSFGTTPNERYKAFTRRIQKNSRLQLRSLFTDIGLVQNHIVLLAMGLRESLSNRPKNQYTAGLAHDSTYDLSKVKHKVTIVLGDSDQLFTYDEISKNLAANNLADVRLVTIKDTPHSPLAGKSGRLLLKAAFDILKIA